jgi:hypothetical protein
VAHWQLIELGFGPSGIQHQIRAGLLYRLHRGVYAVGCASVTWQGRVMAAVLACGPDAVASHHTAAALLALRRSSRMAIHVTVPGRSRRSRRTVTVHAVRSLDRADCTIIDGIPVTTVARTLLDLADNLVPRQLTRMIEDAEKLRVFDLRAIEQTCGRNPGRRGLKPLGKAIAEYLEPPITQAELERRFAEMCDDDGIPRGESNVSVEGWVVDRVWREAKVIVELDSRKHHMTTAAFEVDRVRDTELQLAGYKVIRITWRRLHDERQQVMDQLRRALRLHKPVSERSASGRGPRCAAR